MSKTIKAFLIGLAFVGADAVTITPAAAKSDEIYTSWRNNLAVGGYDVVSFFQGNPVKGKLKYTTNWHGAQWVFANKANLASFMQEPQKYTPAYGGHCAWALAMGKLAKGSPKYWTLKDDRLFLNFNAKINQRWLENQEVFIIEADAKWPEILD